MKKEFQGKCVVITGASEGIGFETAKQFLIHGAKVAICGRSQDKLDRAVESLRETLIQANTVDAPATDDCTENVIYAASCDVCDTKKLRAFLRDAKTALGGMDILVNNAGYMPPAVKLADMQEDLWDYMMAVNLKSVFIGIHDGAELMKEHGGVIINAASYAAVNPSIGGGAYAAAKSAVVSLTRTAGAELAPLGIRVTGYIPGVIDTPLNRDNIKNNGEKLLGPISLRRFGTVQDIAAAILFLASDDASYITGTCLEISGGKFAVQNPQAAW